MASVRRLWLAHMPTHCTHSHTRAHFARGPTTKCKPAPKNTERIEARQGSQRAGTCRFPGPNAAITRPAPVWHPGIVEPGYRAGVNSALVLRADFDMEPPACPFARRLFWNQEVRSRHPKEPLLAPGDNQPSLRRTWRHRHFSLVNVGEVFDPRPSFESTDKPGELRPSLSKCPRSLFDRGDGLYSVALCPALGDERIRRCLRHSDDVGAGQ